MEDTLRGPKLIIKLKADRLNPCSNGRYSQSRGISTSDLLLYVLILVLMEDTLRDYNNDLVCYIESLNPCSNGRYSQRGCQFNIINFVKS